MSDEAAAPPEHRPTRVRRLVLALACAISLVLYLQRYTWGFIKPELSDEFGWDAVTLGWLDSVFLISYSGAQVPAGALCDWFGARLLLGVSILAWSASTLAW